LTRLIDSMRTKHLYSIPTTIFIDTFPKQFNIFKISTFLSHFCFFLSSWEEYLEQLLICSHSKNRITLILVTKQWLNFMINVLKKELTITLKRPVIFFITKVWLLNFMINALKKELTITFRVLLTSASKILVKKSINSNFCLKNINCHFLLSNNYITPSVSKYMSILKKLL